MNKFRNRLYSISNSFHKASNALFQFFKSPFPPNRLAQFERVFERGTSTIGVEEYCRINQFGYVSEESVPSGLVPHVQATATTLVVTTASTKEVFALMRTSSAQRLWIIAGVFSRCRIKVLWFAIRCLKKAGPLRTIDTGNLRMIEIVRNRNRPVPHTRWFVDRNRLPQFFFELRSADIQFVVLRWWDYILDLPEDEDLDILVADEDLKRFSETASRYYGDGKIDLYSVTGLPCTDWNGLPYYPAHLAHQLLRNRVLWNDTCFIPSPEDYFFSLAYHAVLRKGCRSGLPLGPEGTRSPSNCDHDYAAFLTEAAAAVGFFSNANLTCLYRLLEKNRWLPGLDTLRKLSEHNDWLSGQLESAAFPENCGDLVVFVLRNAVIEDGLTEIAREWVEYHGFEILFETQLSDELQSSCSAMIRGGCWHQGPYPRSGGLPALVWITYDYSPREFKSSEEQPSPFVRNRNVQKKTLLRRRLQSFVPPDMSCNYVHSSDDTIEAIEYIGVACPGMLKQIQKLKAERDIEYFSSDWKVDCVLGGWGDRAKVELVTNGTKRGVKKTFRRGMGRFFDRELRVFNEFSGRPWLAKLLELGANYYIVEFIDDILKETTPKEFDQLIRERGHDIVTIIKAFFKKGLALIDFSPSNILIDKTGQLFVCDFEFCQEYEISPKQLSESYDVVGPPSEFSGDLPGRSVECTCSYKKTWQPILKQSFADILAQL